MPRKNTTLSPLTLAARAYYRQHGPRRGNIAACVQHLLALGYKLGPANRAAQAAQVRVSRESKRYRTSVSFETRELYERIRRNGRGNASRAINAWARTL